MPFHSPLEATQALEKGKQLGAQKAAFEQKANAAAAKQALAEAAGQEAAKQNQKVQSGAAAAAGLSAGPKLQESVKAAQDAAALAQQAEQAAARAQQLAGQAEAARAAAANLAAASQPGQPGNRVQTARQARNQAADAADKAWRASNEAKAAALKAQQAAEKAKKAALAAEQVANKAIAEGVPDTKNVGAGAAQLKTAADNAKVKAQGALVNANNAIAGTEAVWNDFGDGVKWDISNPNQAGPRSNAAKNAAQNAVAAGQNAAAQATQAAADAKSAAQKATDLAQKAKDLAGYDSFANADAAAAAVNAANDAAKQAGDAGAIADAAKQELATARDTLNQAKEAKDYLADQVKAREKEIEGAEKARQEAANLVNGATRNLQGLDEEIGRQNTALQTAEAKLKSANQKVEEAEKYKKGVEKAIFRGRELPKGKTGQEICTTGKPEQDPHIAPVLERMSQAERLRQQALEEVNRVKRDLEGVKAKKDLAQKELEKARAALEQERNKVAALEQAKKDAQALATQAEQAVKDAQKGFDELEAEADKAITAAQKAVQAADAAKAQKEQAVDKRIAQLEEEGHGPQRHEGQVTVQQLGERATCLIDPETGTQVDNDTGMLHRGNETASKLNSKEAYVMAEKACRDDLRSQLAATPNIPSYKAEPPIPFTDPNAACTGRTDMRPNTAKALVKTSLGPARAVPLASGAPVFAPAGTEAAPMGGAGANPPPSRAQMDTQALADDAANFTVPTDFTGSKLCGIYRKDAAGNWVLKTMYPQAKTPHPASVLPQAPLRQQKATDPFPGVTLAPYHSAGTMSVGNLPDGLKFDPTTNQIVDDSSKPKQAGTHTFQANVMDNSTPPKVVATKDLTVTFT